MNTIITPSTALKKGLPSSLKCAWFLLGILVLLAGTAQAQATYYWNGATGAAFTTLANWTTGPNGTGSVRTVRNNSDILVFSGGTPSAAITADETIGRLKFMGSTAATLTMSGNITRSLTIQGDGTDEDLIVATGSTLAVAVSVGNNDDAVLNFVLGTAATANIAGAVTFSGGGGNPQSSVVIQLQGASAGAVSFVNGGGLTTKSVASTKLTGAPFNGPNGLAVFGTGATFQQEVADDPYGPASFADGSTYTYIGGNYGPVTTDRTYGNLNFQNTNTLTYGGTNVLTVLNDLTKSGTGSVNITATNGGNNFKGDLTVTAGTLSFTPGTSGGTVALNGTTNQTISGAGTLTFGANAILLINNAAGVTLARPVSVSGSLILTQGLLNTNAATGLLTLAAATPVFGGSNSSYVNGPLARATTGGAANLLFPVGKNGNYRPLRLNVTAQTNAVTYTGEQIESAPAQGTSAPLTRVSFRRYFSLVPSVAPTGYSATLTLTFDTDDFVNYPADGTFVLARRDGASPWASLGRSANTGTATNGAPVSGTLTSAAFNAFPTTTSGFSLASTSTATGYPGVNPLPVELTKFAAATKANGIALDWATASEKNSALFEVQRSANGESFETIAKVTAQGNSAAAHSYAALDRTPLSGLVHYRLRQVDADGTVAYSPVVTARWTVGGEASVYPNPTSGTLYFGHPAEAGKFRVLNGQGHALLTGQTSAAGLDVKQLPAGIYLLEIVTASGRSVQRFVRE